MPMSEWLCTWQWYIQAPAPTCSPAMTWKPKESAGPTIFADGQVFEPPRGDDPGTDGHRFSSGYIGLQVHSTTDVVSYRDIRIKEL